MADRSKHTKRDILNMWQGAHGQLTPAQRRNFLLRPEVDEQLELPWTTVLKAIRRYPKLSDSLVAARKQPRPPAASPPPRRRNKRGVDPAHPVLGSGGLSGVPGTKASYGSGLVHNPGGYARDTRERCEHCGAKVAPGTSHECR